MAQWSGGFSGNTHGTRVQDAETALRHAVEVLRSHDTAGQAKAAATVRRLAKRVLSARLRMLKSRLSALQDSKTERVAADSQEFAALSQRLAQAQGQGIADILSEFAVEEALDPKHSK